MTDLPLPTLLVETIGVFGFAIYVMAYSLLTLRVVQGNSPKYFALNLLAASCVLIGLTASFNLASALIQLFWVVMSLVGLALHLCKPANTA